MSLTVHTADEIRSAVHFTDLIEPMRAAFRDYSAGRAQQTMSTLWPAERQDLADVLVKAGCIAGHDAFVVKIAPWFRSNELAGQAQGGLVAAFSSQDGHPLAVLADEHYLSDVRTAAAGALAASTLAGHDAATAGVLGTGAQAYWQVRALAHVRPIARILVWGRNADRAAKLTRLLTADLPDVEIRARTTPGQVVSESQVVITATAATEPLIQAEWLRPGQHITSIGADTAGKCELEPEVLKLADLVAVDSRAAAADNGNTRRALRAGALTEDDLVELGEILGGAYQRDPAAITVASLVGIGVQDVVAAEVALTLLATRCAGA
jgi:ornithine cyclodeaminase/alanine dehydrogenase-like protein (mu-crystallin family)